MYRCGALSAPGWLPCIGDFMAPGLLTSIGRTSWPLVNVPSIDVGDLRASCLLPSVRGTSGPLVYYQVQGDIRAPGEGTMYGYRGPQGPRSRTMYKGTSGPLVNVPGVDIGDSRALGRQLCIGGPQGPWWMCHACIDIGGPRQLCIGPQSPWRMYHVWI